MCGINGAFNHPDAFKVVQTALNKTKNRGLDGCGYYDGKIHFAKSPDKLKSSSSKNVLGHNLHAIVNTVKQPLKLKDSLLVANCEIYNWKDLGKAKNDSEILLKLLDKGGVKKTLKKLRGVYAFAYLKKDTLWLARDLLGVKPLWYSYSGKSLLFSSEKKALLEYSKEVTELNPRSIIKYNVKSGKLIFLERDFYSITPILKDEKKVIKELKKRIVDSIQIRVPQRKFGLLFSGGLDSVIIVKVLKDLGCDFTCYTAATSKEAPDFIAAKKAAKMLGLKLKTKVVKDIKPYLKKVVPLIEDSNVVKVGVALPLYISCELAKKDGNKVIFSGSGADELFAGYARYKKDLKKVNKDCYSDILKIYEKNNYRDDVLTMNNNLELRVPFLDESIVSFGLKIDSKLKIKNDVEKYILRQVALELGLSEEFALRKKKAAQYGSWFDKAIGKLSKNKSEYLKQFYQTPNLKLAALVSSGKDSVYAMYTMMQQNYDISCMVTMKSKNPDSFMFQSEGIGIAKLQSKSFGIPLLEQETKGEKEKELQDLRKVLGKAKKKYGIEGVVSGALYSNYQRERIEKVCDSLGLKIFSPLWHIDQEQEMRDLIKKGFRFVLVRISADGLSKEWLGKVITNKDIDKLVKLNEKIGFNIAGEGGEFETVMVDGPLFKKKVDIQDAQIVMEGECLGYYKIKKARLI
jgi:diphthine-ammonia ligase